MFNIKNAGPSFVMVHVYASKEFPDLYIFKFEITIQMSLKVISMTSNDLNNICSISISVHDFNDRIKMMGILQKVLSKIVLKSTFICKKLVFVFSHINNQKSKVLFENRIAFNERDDGPKDKTVGFLKEKCVYFKSFVKKVLKYNGKFILLTFVEDFNRKNLFIFMYIPHSQRRFIVKFRISAIEENLPKSYKKVLQTHKTSYFGPKIMHYANKFKFSSKKLMQAQVAASAKSFGENPAGTPKEYRPQINYLLWIELAQLYFINNKWFLSFNNLNGIAKEFISMEILNQEKILIEVYINNYLNQFQIMQAFKNIRFNEVEDFKLEITISKSGEFFKHAIPLSLKRVIENLKPKDQQEILRQAMINGYSFLVVGSHIKAEAIREIYQQELRYKEITMSSMKDTNNILVSLFRKRFTKRSLFGGDVSKEMKGSLPVQTIKQTIMARSVIFSTVLTLRPKRVFTIYIIVLSEIISQASRLFNLRFQDPKLQRARVRSEVSR